MSSYDAVSLFGGPGGFDWAARSLGISTLAIEIDRDANRTAKAAGHMSIQADVRDFGPEQIPLTQTPGLLAGPPCPTFSTTGDGSGRRDIPILLDELIKVAWGAPIDSKLFRDPRTPLIMEPMRWISEAFDMGRPFRWVVLEQVREAILVWEAYAVQLRLMGYDVLVDVGRTEKYGVPQSRRRAVLLARRKHPSPLCWPEATHSEFYPHTPERQDPGMPRWVSMADALGWGMTHRPSQTVTGGGSRTGGAEPFANGSRQRMATEREEGRWKEPFKVVSNYSTNSDYTKRGVRTSDQPSSTITSKANRVKVEPSCLRIGPREAAILQTFPEDYPWVGSKNSQHQQIGNAVPPLFAEHLLKAILAP